MKLLFPFIFAFLFAFQWVFSQNNDLPYPRKETLTLADEYIKKAEYYTNPYTICSVSADSSLFYYQKAADIYLNREQWESYFHYSLRMANLALAKYDSDRSCSVNIYNQILNIIEDRALYYPDVQIQVYVTLSQLSGYLRRTGQNTKTYLERAENLCLKEYGEGHPLMILIHSEWGSYYGWKKHNSLSIEYHYKALDLWDKLLLEQEPTLFKYSLPTPSKISRRLILFLKVPEGGKLKQKTGELLLSALDLQLRLFGDQHPQVAAQYLRVGEHFLWPLHNRGLAKEFLQRAFTLGQQLYGEDHLFVGNCAHALRYALELSDRTKSLKMEVLAIDIQTQTFKKYGMPPYLGYTVNEKMIEKTNKKVERAFYKKKLLFPIWQKEFGETLSKLKSLYKKQEQWKPIFEEALAFHYQKAIQLIAENQYWSALNKLEFAIRLKKAGQLKYPFGKIDFNIKKAKCLLAVHDTYTAYQLLQENLERVKDPTQKAILTTLLGDALSAFHDLEQADKHYDQSIQWLKENPLTKDNWLGKARLEIKRKNFETAIQYFQTAKKYASQANEIYDIQIAIADCHSHLQQFDNATAIFETLEAVDCIEQLTFKPQFKEKEADMYFLKGANEKALDLYEENREWHFNQQNYPALLLQEGKYVEAIKQCNILGYINFLFSSQRSSYQMDALYINPPLLEGHQQLPIIKILHLKAKTFYNWYQQETQLLKDLKFSLETYQQVDGLLQKEMEKAVNQAARQHLIELSKVIYKDALIAAKTYKNVSGEDSFVQYFEAKEKDKK